MGHGSVFVWVGESSVTAYDPLPAAAQKSQKEQVQCMQLPSDLLNDSFIRRQCRQLSKSSTVLTDTNLRSLFHDLGFSSVTPALMWC